MAKRKVRIYKDPIRKGEKRSKLKNFLFIAQQGTAGAPQGGPMHQMPDGTMMAGATHGEAPQPQQGMSSPEQEELLRYVYESLDNDSTDPQTLYETLTKQGVDPNIVKSAIELSIQRIVQEKESSVSDKKVAQANEATAEAEANTINLQEEQKEAAALEEQLLIDQINEDSSLADDVIKF